MDSRVRKPEEAGKHVCELRKTSESRLQRLPPNAKIISRLKRAFQKLIIVSEEHPFTKYYLRSRAAIAFERHRHGSSSSYWWIIHPCSRLRFMWDKLMAAVFLYFFIAVPYVKAFFRVCSREIAYHNYFIYPAYLVCVLDIVMNFVTGYASPDGDRILLDPVVIVRHYSRGFFAIDLLTSVSYTWFTRAILPPGLNPSFLAVLAELIPLLKIFRIKTLRYYIKQIHAAWGWSSVTDVSVWISLLTILIFHWSACLTWAFPFVVLHATGTAIEDSDIVVVQNDVYKQSSGMIYLHSLHMGLSNLVGSNFIEIRKISHADKLIRCFLLLFGTAYTVYLIVVVLQLVESSAEPELKYQEIMHRVKQYSYDKKLPKDLERKLISYYEFRFEGSYFEEQTIATILPNHLKQEINLHSNHGRLLESSAIFSNLPKTFVMTIMSAVQPMVYLQDDVVYKTSEEGDGIYFIASGTVTMINSRGREIMQLEDGDHFGELNVLNSEAGENVTVIALETCELLLLRRRHFHRLVEPASEFYKRLQEVVVDRLAQITLANKLSDEEERIKKRRSSEFRRLLLRTGDVL